MTTKTYLNSLSADILILSIEDRYITSLPDLTRFTNLKELYCSNNLLTSLPNNLPQGLEILHCSKNKLSSLPDLTRFKNLKELYCSNNQLNSLPNHLPQSLEKIHCSSNQLKYLPTILPQNLKALYCFENKLTYLPNLSEKMLYFIFWNNPIFDILDVNNNSLTKVKENIIIFNNNRHLQYSLQFEKQFIKWLWKSREKKMMEKYHPNYLWKNLEEDTDLDVFLNNW